MAHDYKHTVNRQNQRNKPAPSPARFTLLIGFGSGLAVGLLIAFLIYLMGVDTSSQPRNLPNADAQPKVEAASKADKKSPQNLTAPQAAPPRFEFYTILPEREVVIPDAEVNPLPTNQAPPRQGEPASPTKDPSSYVLQAGSFKLHKDAETLRARIALLGVVATIQAVTLNQGERWHRVRIGPLATLDELNRVRRRLDENGISALLIRQSD